MWQRNEGFWGGEYFIVKLSKCSGGPTPATQFIDTHFHVKSGNSKKEREPWERVWPSWGVRHEALRRCGWEARIGGTWHLYTPKSSHVQEIPPQKNRRMGVSYWQFLIVYWSHITFPGMCEKWFCSPFNGNTSPSCKWGILIWFRAFR